MENTARLKNIVRADEVIGVKVINTTKEDLGKIYQIVLNKLSGQVKYLVLESGGFLGLGSKLFAIPWESIHYDIEEESFILDISKDRLCAAPGFDADNWPVMTDESWGKSISDYYSMAL